MVRWLLSIPRNLSHRYSAEACGRLDNQAFFPAGSMQLKKYRCGSVTRSAGRAGWLDCTRRPPLLIAPGRQSNPAAWRQRFGYRRLNSATGIEIETVLNAMVSAR